MNEETRIKPREKRNVDIPEGFRHEIIAPSKSHKARVKEKLLGKLSDRSLRYEFENLNDIPISITISKLKK